MANSKISNLGALTTVNNDALFAVVQTNGSNLVTYKGDVDQVATAMQTRLTVPTYVKTWNANTNTPTLASGAATAGTSYLVNIAGTTTLDGISTWDIGDIAYNDGVTWTKVTTTEAGVFTHTTEWGGSIPDTAGNILYTKNGRTVTLVFPLVTATSDATASISAITKLPASLWPIIAINQEVNVVVNNISISGIVNVLDGDGSVIWFAGENGDSFTTGQINGFNAQAITYISAT